ncbi:MAG: hypothetical protein HOW73_51245 [Polyangiaceae bacterium]|nr:hypothetical protein [Polyangiaceae bacterium]
MPFVCQRLEAPPNGLVEFEFEEPIRRYAIGISYWKLSFAAGTDHWVRALELYTKVIDQTDERKIRAQVTAVLCDAAASGHQLSAADSKIVLACVAFVGRDDGNFENHTDANGTTYDVENPALPFMTGFSLSNPEQDTRVTTIALSAWFKPSGAGGVVSVEAELKNGDDAMSQQSLSYALATGTQKKPDLLVQSNISGTMNGYHEVVFDRPIVDGVVLIQELYVGFAKPHNVAFVGGGPESVQVGRERLTYYNGGAFISDTSGNTQTADSYTTLLAFAIPGLSISFFAENPLDVAVQELRLRAQGTGDWGANLLKAPIAPQRGAGIDTTVRAYVCDIKVVYADSRTAELDGYDFGRIPRPSVRLPIPE